jgi:hypothetical protein
VSNKNGCLPSVLSVPTGFYLSHHSTFSRHSREDGNPGSPFLWMVSHEKGNERSSDMQKVRRGKGKRKKEKLRSQE